MFVYLDNSATTRPYDSVIERMAEIQRKSYGNPSSLHTAGIEAEKNVKEARRAFAGAIGADEGELCFTSGGTEADNTVLRGVCRSRKRRGKKIITTAVEHPAVLEPAAQLEAMGFEVEYIGVDEKCRLNIEQLKNALSEDVIMISVMSVNNETGTVMPIEEIGRLKEAFNRANGTDILLHTDAVQALGKIPINMRGNFKNVDMMSVSSHKIHGPKGVGGLYIRKGLTLYPLMLGGGQERGMRSGTENVEGICGFGEALGIAAECFEDRLQKIASARRILLETLKDGVDDIIINSPQVAAELAEEESFRGNFKGDCAENSGDYKRKKIENSTVQLGCPSVLSVSFLGTRGEVLLHTLEQDNIFVSTGSACSSHKKGQSHVLSAMGLSPKEIEGTIRFSFSEFNTAEEMEYAADKVIKAVKRFRRLGSFR